jgi:hypothetical protein
MKKFIFKIFNFFLIIVLLSYFIEYFVTFKLKSGNRYYFQSDWLDLKNHNSDVLIIGNSRSFVHCDPFMIQNKFNISAEVLAQNGQSIHLLWIKFKEYIKVNNFPKEIYLQFDQTFVVDKNELFGFKYYNFNFFSDRINMTSLKNWNGYSDVYRFLPLASIEPYTALKILTNDTIKSYEVFENCRGYLPVNRKWKANWNKINIQNLEYKQISKYTDSFIVFSKNNNIKLYALFTPQTSISYKIENTNKLVKIISDLQVKYNKEITFLNYNNSVVYQDSTLFYNHLHLNYKGSQLFMKYWLNDSNSFKSFPRNKL